MGREAKDKWCILTTAGPRTLALASALRGAGMDAWTPVRTQRRVGRGKQRHKVVMINLPITPTFVFVRAEHLGELLRIRDLPVSPYPAFRIMRHYGDIPLVADAGLSPLRAAEERFAQSLLKTIRRRIAPGSEVRMNKGGFAGMTGIVESSSGKEARVDFGHGFVVSIATYLLGTDVVQAGPLPALGIAA